MRFVAGRGAVADRLVRGAALAELLLAGNRRHRGLPAGAPWQSKGTAVAETLKPGRSIGKRGKKHARRKSSIGKNMHLSFQMNKI